MRVNLQRTRSGKNILNRYQGTHVELGFTEIGFQISQLNHLIPHRQLRELKQIHSNRTLHTQEIDSKSEGDGIWVTTPQVLAIIKTADCVPLTFWHQRECLGGILHVGWRGLHQGIEAQIIPWLKSRGTKAEEIHFFMGPAIEQSCYEVGPELVEQFSDKPYANQIFQQQGDGKFTMDLKEGVRQALIHQGISDTQIASSPLCTHCESDRFPSYRRDGATGKRIYSFLIFH